MPTISTRHLDRLPEVDTLKKLLQSLAMLDAIMSPDEWDGRYYSFNSRWSKGHTKGSMRNGQGDEFFALFNRAGCFLKGFAHEYPMTPYRTDPPEIWPGLLSDVPKEFKSGLNEPAFSMNEVTFCIWRRYEDDAWAHGPVKFPKGPDPDGSEYLLAILDGKPSSYCIYAQDNYETEEPLPKKSVAHVYQHLPLTKEIVESLNPEATLKKLAKDLKEIGYPVG